MNRRLCRRPRHLWATAPARRENRRVSVERPTYHEAWHRVESSRPRLRSGVQTRHQRFRGRDWWIVEDPASNQYFRMNRPAYRFVGLMDGRRTVDECWRLCMDSMGDGAPTQGEVISLLGQLYGSNLLTTGVGEGTEGGAGFSEDAEAMFRRQRRRITLETQGRLAGFLSLRIPLYDPDRVFDVMATMFGWCFTAWGFGLWLALLIAGLAALPGRVDELVNSASTALAPGNLPWLYLSFFLAKLVHESGHGVACKVFGRREGSGGEVHAIGIMLLVLLPAPYVDATSAWGLRSKWKRIVIGGAGMMAELALAAVAALIWARTAEGTVLHAVAANVIFIAGVSTLLFNANPLLRYDGYYILSDLLEIPNLQQRSREFLKRFFRRSIFGARTGAEKARSRSERWLLGTFGIASTGYLLFVTVAITIYVADQWFFVGALLAVAAAMLWFVAPVVKLVRYLATDPELDRTRPRAVWSVVGFIVVSALLLGLVPAPRNVRVTGVVEAEASAEVRAPIHGFIEWTAPAGAAVSAGAPLVRASNAAAEAEYRVLQARLEGFHARRRQALAERPAEAAIESERIAAISGQAEYAADQLASMVVTAPITGLWAPQEDAPPTGAYVQRGQRLGTVVNVSRMRVRAAAEQATAASLLGSEHLKGHVRVSGRPDVEWECRVERVVEAGRAELPSEALGTSAGGSLRENQNAERRGETAERVFEVILSAPVEGGATALHVPPGTRIVARIALAPEPVAAQAIRWIRQSFQRRFGG